MVLTMATRRARRMPTTLKGELYASDKEQYEYFDASERPKKGRVC